MQQVLHKRRPSHNYSEETKRRCLEMINKNNNNRAFSLRALAKLPNNPSRTTLQTWVRENQQVNTPPLPPKRHGPTPKLSMGEIMVVGGWILEEGQHHEVVSGNKVREFVLESFNEHISKPTVSRYLQKVAITSHSAKIRDPKYLRRTLTRDLHKFLLNLHKSLRGVPLSKIVCVDVCKFSSYNLVLRTYSPTGIYIYFLFISIK